MGNVAAWEIGESGPNRLPASAVDLEEHLEAWIETDPSLLQTGLMVVGRQTQTDAGPLDLLAIDQSGRWYVIEVKRGQVTRETIAQAVDYASCIAFMPSKDLKAKVEEYLTRRGTSQRESFDGLKHKLGLDDQEGRRPVGVVVVGIGRDPGLDRVVNFLSDANLPISVVAFSALRTASGTRVLLRDMAEAEGDVRAQDPWSIDAVREKAEQAGTGKLFQRIHEAAVRHGLHAAPRKNAVMYAPPTNRTRCLLTTAYNRSRSGGIWVYVAADVFPEFFNVTVESATEMLGAPGWRDLGSDGVERLVKGLDQLFAAAPAP